MTRSIHAVFIALAGLGIYGPLTSTCLSQGIPLLGTGGRTVPSQAYDLAQNALASGNFSDALELAEQEYKGCMKFGADRWIDSTAAAAIVGECCFEQGRYRDAIGFYNEAIIRAASHGNWLEDIRFPSQPLRIKNSRPQQLWGQSPRAIKISDLPDRMSIRMALIRKVFCRMVAYWQHQLTIPYAHKRSCGHSPSAFIVVLISLGQWLEMETC